MAGRPIMGSQSGTNRGLEGKVRHRLMEDDRTGLITPNIEVRRVGRVT